MYCLFGLTLLVAFVKSVPIGTPSQGCGIEAGDTPLHQNPWLAFLEFRKSGVNSGYRCAGSLITSKYVVTAAHCLKKIKFTRLKVRLGEYNVTTRLDCLTCGKCADPPLSIDVEAYTVHPEYRNFANDIALLKLKYAAPYTDFIRPVCLPSADFKLQLNKTTFVASGWGELNKGKYTEVKKHIHLPYKVNAECIKAYPYTILPDKIICAGGESGKDTCSGDSGGPLTLAVEGHIQLWGVTNAGNPHCGTAGYPGVYTQVSGYLDWIREVIESEN